MAEPARHAVAAAQDDLGVLDGKAITVRRRRRVVHLKRLDIILGQDAAHNHPGILAGVKVDRLHARDDGRRRQRRQQKIQRTLPHWLKRLTIVVPPLIITAQLSD